jgi:hypothetical protein
MTDIIHSLFQHEDIVSVVPTRAKSSCNLFLWKKRRGRRLGNNVIHATSPYPPLVQGQGNIYLFLDLEWM